MAGGATPRSLASGLVARGAPHVAGWLSPDALCAAPDWAKACGFDGDGCHSQYRPLSPAERQIALLLLKGLSHKEIAQIRLVSETTVRQQARSLYRKAGLSGRNDLAAFFLEDLLGPREASTTSTRAASG